MTNLVTIVGQIVGNAANGQFTYAFGYDPITRLSYPAQQTANSNFQVIDPATEETLAGAVTTLTAIAASSTSTAAETTAAANSLAAIQTATASAGRCTLTQTIVQLGQGQAYTFAANPARKSLRWMITGTGNLAVAPGTTAPQDGNSGMVYNGDAVVGTQGSSETFDGPAVPTNAFSFLAVSGASNLVIWESV